MDSAEMLRHRNAHFLAQIDQPLSEPVAAQCSRCEAVEGVCLESSRTAYHWDGVTGLNPNAPVLLCRPCAEDHHEHWDEMWSHVHG